MKIKNKWRSSKKEKSSAKIRGCLLNQKTSGHPTKKWCYVREVSNVPRHVASRAQKLWNYRLQQVQDHVTKTAFNNYEYHASRCLTPLIWIIKLTTHFFVFFNQGINHKITKVSFLSQTCPSFCVRGLTSNAFRIALNHLAFCYTRFDSYVSLFIISFSFSSSTLSLQRIEFLCINDNNNCNNNCIQSERFEYIYHISCI